MSYFENVLIEHFYNEITAAISGQTFCAAAALNISMGVELFNT
jgi:hypothetical protein